MTKRSGRGDGDEPRDDSGAGSAHGGPRELPPKAPETGDLPIKHADGTYVLDAAEKALLEEVLALAAQTSAKVEAELVGFGRLVFTKVFGSNSKAVLEEATQPNRVWRELRRRAGGPTLRLTDDHLDAGLRIAVWDKVVNDRNFTKLDLEWKKLLLPLDDKDKLREAAQHVIDHDLTWRATKKYVAEVRKADGDQPKTQVTEKRIGAKVDGVLDLFGDAKTRKRAGVVLAKLPPEKRAAAKKKLQDLLAVVRLVLDDIDD